MRAEYPLTGLQEGMLFHWLRDPRAGVDVEQIVCTLEGVDIPAFLRAWEDLVRRHAPLRTRFQWKDTDVPVQQVLADVPVNAREVDVRALTADEQRHSVDSYLAEDRRAAFELSSPPLFRLAFFRLAEHRYEFVWTFPHILLDGRSFTLLLRELIATYNTVAGGHEPTLPTPRSFGDFVDWLEQQERASQAAFWTRALAGFVTPVFPDLGAVVATAPGEEYAALSVRLSVVDTTALRSFAEKHGLTLNTMVQGAWALLLGRYARAKDVVFGATRACRRTALGGDASVDQMVGLFINTLPVRVRLNPEQPVIEWLQQIRADQVAVREVEHTSLSLVQTASGLPPGTPLFETLMVFENQEQATSFNSIDPHFVNFRLIEKSNFPISLHAFGEPGLRLRIEYYRTRFDDGAITRMLGHLAVLLGQMVKRGDHPLDELDPLTLAERLQFLVDWNDTKANFPAEATIHGLIEAQVRLRPDAIAVECVEHGVRHTLSYRELDRRANRLAWTLAQAGIGPDDRIAMCVERSLHAVVAILGILKAGAAYVPIDPAYPDERVAFIVRDADAKSIVVSGAQRERVASLGLGRPLVDVQALGPDGTPDGAPLASVGPRNLAYVIYTSGSTGHPKGVMVEHRNVTRLLVNDRSLFAFDEHDVWTVFHSFAFDFSVWELFGALVYGGRAVIVPRIVAQSPPDFLALLEETQTTVLNQVPSAFYALMQEALAQPPSASLAIRYVIFGGEALNPALLAEWHSRWPSAQLINMFGITETTVHVTYKEIGDAEIAAGISNIGRPIPTLTAFVLDSALRPVPVGVIGEICVGGLGVARGYLNRPELSAERFVPDPFGRGERLYRSGDLGRVLSTGEIEYLGRSDQQVKLRGFRIEVGEIEATLVAHNGVRQAAVLLRNDPGIEPRLVAYCVLTPDAGTSAADLRLHLGGVLPVHMVPSAFVMLPVLPLTSSGKLDRKALPLPELDRTCTAAVPPRDEIEAAVLRIWTDVLGVKDIGVTDHFNEVGGNSLAAVRVFGRIAREFDRKLQLVTMLKHDTVEQIAELLREPGEQEAWNCIVPFTTTGSGFPIFCPHAQTGYVLIYQYFAKEVAAHHPVYGIQSLGNWGTQQPQETIPQMVDYYVAEILKVRPHGPYIFFAVSLGGWIALELAVAMRARGHEVRVLAMYDTAGPGYPRFTPYGRLLKFIRERGGISTRRVRRIFERHAIHGRTLRTIYRNVRVVARWWLEKLRRDYLYWRYEHENPPHDFSMPANLSRFRLASRRITRGYQIPYYDGKITYFRADIQQRGVIEDATNGWGDNCSELEIHPVPGFHTEGMNYPFVADVARMFLDCAARAERAGVSCPPDIMGFASRATPSAVVGHSKPY